MAKNRPHILGGLAWVFAPVLEHRRAWAVLNLLYFGTIGLGVAYAAAEPNIQRSLLQQVGEAFAPQGGLAAVGEAYLQGRLLPAIALTFLINLVGGSLLTLTASSLAIPFLGILVGLLRALLWGLLFSPFGGTIPAAVMAAAAPHLGVVALEGEGYVVAMLGVWVWWRPVLSGPGDRLQWWWSGLLYQGRIYVAVAFLLALAAIYEALELIYLVPRLMPVAP
jgi:hypothetical protein